MPAPAGSDEPQRKRSRWGSKKEEVTDPLLIAVQMGIPLVALQQMSSEQKASLPLVKRRVDEIDVLLRLPDCGVADVPPERRSPSPEPIFDRHGTRVNSREARRRTALLDERQKLLDSTKPKQATHALAAPAGGGGQQKHWRKIIVPIDKYPGYNFFGAIIGPRGNAQKRMEKESGCKIVVRGKGAIKEGCSRHDGRPPQAEDEEPMHVIIEGPDEPTVEAGQRMIETVLNPYGQDAMDIKEKQMKELAMLNGTLKDDSALAAAATWSQQAAKGALFQQHRNLPPPGAASGGGGGGGGGGSAPSMDDEYANFMAELGGGGGEGGGPPPPASAPAPPWARPESEGGIGSGMRGHAAPRRRGLPPVAGCRRRPPCCHQRPRRCHQRPRRCRLPLLRHCRRRHPTPLHLRRPGRACQRRRTQQALRRIRPSGVPRPTATACDVPTSTGLPWWAATPASAPAPWVLGWRTAAAAAAACRRSSPLHLRLTTTNHRRRRHRTSKYVM